MPNITDSEYESIEKCLNSAIHEIVYACKHAEDDELEEASDCLVSAQLVIDAVAQEIVTEHSRDGVKA